MANTLTGLIGPLYEALNVVSREFVGFIPAVTKDNGNFSRAALGQTVTSFTVPPVVGINIVPGVTAPNSGDQVLGTVNMTLTKARAYEMRWNGEEQLAITNAGPNFPPVFGQQFQQAFRAAVNEIEVDIANVAYLNASRASGTAGTAPFGVANDLTDFSNTAQILDENGAPALPRHLIVGSNAMNNLRGKQSVLFKMNESGTDDLLRRGIVGRTEGFEVGYSPTISPITKGTGAGYVVNNGGGYPVGATAIILGTGTGTVLAGDVVTFAGDTNKYVVAAGIAAPGTITLQAPGLRLAVANAAAMTIGASFKPNIGFTEDGLLLATRMPALPMRLDGSRGDMGLHQTIVDPFSGIAFDVGMYEQYHQLKIEIGIVWGVAAPNPSHIAILLG